jgi:hypothetical protein
MNELVMTSVTSILLPVFVGADRRGQGKTAREMSTYRQDEKDSTESVKTYVTVSQEKNSVL